MLSCSLWTVVLRERGRAALVGGVLVRVPLLWRTPPPSVDANEVHDRIDFVYYRGTGVTATDAVTVGIDDTNPNTDIAITAYPSDHRAVLGTFVLPKAGE